MTLTFRDLFNNPDHFLFAFDGDDALFRPMDRGAYQRSIFLDGRISTAGEGMMRIPTAQLFDAAPQGATPTVHWIFHMAHCGSTLLARAFDTCSDRLVLREPAALRQLAVARSDDPGWCHALKVVLAFLGRSYDDKSAVVKANVPVNFILPSLLALQPSARGVLLHFGLSDYLLAILRSEGHRAWLRLVCDEMAIASGSDAERAAALWLAQIEAYEAALASQPGLASLDAALLLADPEPAIRAVAAHFDIVLPGELRGLLSASAKRPGETFSPEERAGRQVRLRDELTDDLETARRWIDRAAISLPERLANPLVAGGAPLLS